MFNPDFLKAIGSSRRWHLGTWIAMAAVVLGSPLYAQQVRPPSPTQLEWRIPSLVATPKTEPHAGQRGYLTYRNACGVSGEDKGDRFLRS